MEIVCGDLNIMADIWLIVAMVSMLESWVLSEPTFKTETECEIFAVKHAEDLNLHVNGVFNMPVSKINPLFCITKKELDDSNTKNGIYI